jgi:hypothetical protein
LSGREFTGEHKKNISKNHHNVKGDKNPKWKGGRTYSEQGYVYIWKPKHKYATSDGYVLEHRLIMEQHLNRTLDSEEVVHHINGVRDDNRLENLELYENNGKHIKQHNGDNPDWGKHSPST